MTRSSRLAAALVAGLFLALHLPFLPPSLEDLDSINFALGIRRFDVALHQPHPPGYPLFMFFAKALHGLGLSEVHSLSLLSVLGGALAVFGCLRLFEALNRDQPDSVFTWMGVLLVVTCPLYWVTAVRPLSDALGLAAVLTVQALIVTAPSAGALMFAAGAAGLAAGVRSQVVWLTVPLVGLAVARLPRAVRRRGLAAAFTAYAVLALVWALPLVIISGGPLTYGRTFFNQGAEDLTGVAMLATTHTPGLLVRTLQDTFVAPWGYSQTAAALLALALIGCVQMLLHARSALITVAVAFGPYLAFHLLFQEAITTRYALPLIVPVVYLAMRGTSYLPRTPAMGVALAIAVSAILVDDGALYGYARMEAPAFRMLGDMAAAAPPEGLPRPVLAMHRKDEFDMRRPIQWIGDKMPAIAAHLPAPPKHEWLELVKYWNQGGHGPVWFVADPLRSDLALVRAPRRRTLYRWPMTFPMLIGGARPNEMDWYAFEAPDWYLDEGWALTPETAGIAREDHRGPGVAPIRGWIRRWNQPLTLMIGGRNLAPGGPPARVRVAIDGATVDEVTVAPGFFLRMLDVPTPAGTGEYAVVSVESDSQDLAIEQFDAQPTGRVVFGFGEGWNELEYNPTTGVLWRWSSDRSALRLRAEGHAVALTLRGELEAASTSHVIVRLGEAVAASFDVGKAFSRTVILPASSLPSGESVVTIESSAWSVPAETRWRSKDRRRLGLKLFECSLTPAS